MNIKAHVVLIIFLVCVGLGCQRQHPSKAFYEEIVSPCLDLSVVNQHDKEKTIVKISNKCPKDAVVFWFKNNDSVELLNPYTILEGILTNAKTTQDSAICIWQFVYKSGRYQNFDFDQRLHDNVNPIALVTFPYFMCGEKAGILVNLAMLSNIPARSLLLDGHVVTELYFDNAWHLFDADHGYYFRKKDGKIASAKELAKKTVRMYIQSLTLAPGATAYKVIAYPSYLHDFSDKMIDTSMLIKNYSSTNTAITLYPNEHIVFTLTKPSLIARALDPYRQPNTKGIYYMKPSLNSNVEIKEHDTIVCKIRLPYYIKRLNIRSDKFLQTDVLISCQDRLTKRRIYESLGTLSTNKNLQKTFNAPNTKEIYYEIEVIFTKLNSADLEFIDMQWEFEFNPTILSFSELSIFNIKTNRNQ